MQSLNDPLAVAILRSIPPDVLQRLLEENPSFSRLDIVNYVLRDPTALNLINAYVTQTTSGPSIINNNGSGVTNTTTTVTTIMTNGTLPSGGDLSGLFATQNQINTSGGSSSQGGFQVSSNSTSSGGQPSRGSYFYPDISNLGIRNHK